MFQRCRAFKFRGALSKITALTKGSKICCASAGNQKNVQTVIISIRGGGPCAGVCLPIKSLIPNCRTFAVSGDNFPNTYIKCQKEKNRKIDPIA